MSVKEGVTVRKQLGQLLSALRGRWGQNLEEDGLTNDGSW
jgi:hypothetical protein